MTKVLILGATGGTGQHVVRLARSRGHDVTVLARHPDRLPADVTGVTVVRGTVEDPAALGEAMRGQGAVVSALGRGTSLKSGGLIAGAMPGIVKAMDVAGVKRLVFTSAYGVGETYRDTPLVPRVMIAVMLRDLYADKIAGEAVLRGSALDWTIVYPSTLTNGAPEGRYRVGERLRLRGLPTIARADLAAFLVAQVEDRTYLRKGVLISR